MQYYGITNEVDDTGRIQSSYSKRLSREDKDMLVRTVLAAEKWELALAVRIYPRTSSTVHTMNTQQEKTAKKKKIKKQK
jgi:hypothetical protein